MWVSRRTFPYVIEKENKNLCQQQQQQNQKKTITIKTLPSHILPFQRWKKCCAVHNVAFA